MSLEVVSTTPIEPCRCGHKGIEFTKSTGGGLFIISCIMCGANDGTGYYDKVSATKAWNKRRQRERDQTPPASDPINPSHYKSHPAKCQCGRPIECIDVVRHLGFSVGNAIKYLWRTGLKGDAIEDLTKARWYIDDEIAKREREANADGD